MSFFIIDIIQYNFLWVNAIFLSLFHSRICLHTVYNYHLFTTFCQSTSILCVLMLGFGFQLCGPICWNHFLTDDANIHTYSTSFFLPGSFIIFLFALFNSRNGKNIDTHLFNVTKLKWHIYSSSISSISSSGSSYSLPFAAFSSWYTCYWPACVPAFSPSTYVYAVHSAHNTVHWAANFAKWKLIEKVLANAGAFYYPFRDPINGDFAMKFETIFLPILSFAFLTLGLLWS